MSWGTRIFISFLVFGAIMAVMVTISMREDVGLVRPDYYEEELKYQDQIDRVRNFDNLNFKPEISFDKEEGICYLNFPGELLENPIEGKAYFFRPSDSDQDKVFGFQVEEEGKLQFSIKELITGLWVLKVDWSDGHKEYYFEKNIFL